MERIDDGGQRIDVMALRTLCGEVKDRPDEIPVDALRLFHIEG
ncbi:hypothetical protein [Phenylobacterium sp.]|nr:hypothetical protein [Phenylobacterium sp.]